MTIIFILIMALATAAFIFYPFFREKSGAAAPVKSKSVARRKNADQEIEQAVLKLRKQKGKVCPRCGAQNAVNARYCSQCAISLTKGK